MAYKTQTQVIDEARPYETLARHLLFREYKDGKHTMDEWVDLTLKLSDVSRYEANHREKTFAALKKSQYASALMILEYTRDYQTVG
jgi:hypothetical protein